MIFVRLLHTPTADQKTVTFLPYQYYQYFVYCITSFEEKRTAHAAAVSILGSGGTAHTAMSAQLLTYDTTPCLRRLRVVQLRENNQQRLLQHASLSRGFLTTTVI